MKKRLSDGRYTLFEFSESGDDVTHCYESDSDANQSCCESEKKHEEEKEWIPKPVKRKLKKNITWAPRKKGNNYFNEVNV